MHIAELLLLIFSLYVFFIDCIIPIVTVVVTKCLI